MIEIPLTSSPEQNFSIIIDGTKYGIRVILNHRGSFWSISLSLDNGDVINGISLVSGVNLMDNYNLPLKNMYIINLNKLNEDPSEIDLGIVSRLFILTDEEISNVSSV